MTCLKIVFRTEGMWSPWRIPYIERMPEGPGKESDSEMPAAEGSEAKDGVELKVSHPSASIERY